MQHVERKFGICFQALALETAREHATQIHTHTTHTHTHKHTHTHSENHAFTAISPISIFSLISSLIVIPQIYINIIIRQISSESLRYI